MFTALNKVRTERKDGSICMVHPSEAETRNKRELSKRALSKIMMERGKSIAFTHNLKRLGLLL